MARPAPHLSVRVEPVETRVAHAEGAHRTSTRPARSAWGARALLPLGVALLLGSPLAQAAEEPAKTSRVPQPVIEAARGGQCVEPAADMRRNHMNYLKHQRDDTLRGGVRGAKYSLKACIECHASPATHSVAAAPTNFCVSCHSYAAVKVDCFECHATQPGKAQTSFQPLVHPRGAHAALSRQLRQLVTQPAASP